MEARPVQVPVDSEGCSPDTVSEEKETPEAPSLTAEQIKELRAEYREDRKELVDFEQKYAESFDKIALTILSGALVLSVGFVKDIAPHPLPWSTPFLLLSWVFLVAGILASMLGLYWAQRAFEREGSIRVDRYRHDMRTPTELDYWDNVFVQKVHSANKFVIFAIVAGVSLVVIFVSWNFVAKAFNAPINTVKKDISISKSPEPGAAAPPSNRSIPTPGTQNPKPTPKEERPKK